MITNSTGSVSDGACIIRAGFGSKRQANGVSIEAFQCEADTFGRDLDTTGLVEVSW